MKKLFFQLYNPCGLFNQITSLELGVGLSYETKRQLVWHNINNPFNHDYNARVPIFSANYAYNDRNGLVDKDIYPKITDLLDWNNKESNVFIDDIVETFSSDAVKINNLMQHYYSNVEDSEFGEGRSLLNFSSEHDYDIRYTLGYYSRFFNNRSDGLNNELLSVRFKPEYYELAEQIAKSLGNFNGAHLRLTDHILRCNTSGDMFNSGLATINNHLPIVLCTDEPNSEMIKNSDYNFILLDDYILKNFYNEFRQLKFKEEVSFGIVNNLVMHYSQDFIGTPGSTYTGYIQRNINQTNNIEFKLFGEEHKSNGPYSWNGHYHDTETKQWWREWKECKI
jgi:hypothetical protein